MRYVLSIFMCMLVLVAEGCGPSPTPTVQTSIGPAATAPPVVVTPAAPTATAAEAATSTVKAGTSTITVTSAAFSEGGTIPKKYTCDGASVSPPLQWSGAPAATQSYTLIVADPDAPSGTFIHWVDYDIPSSQRQLAEGAQAGKQGLNGARKPGYTGPCPPSGVHRYVFTVYALDVPTLNLGAGATRDQVQQAMQGHILAQGQLIGRYGR